MVVLAVSQFGVSAAVLMEHSSLRIVKTSESDAPRAVPMMNKSEFRDRNWRTVA
jgi:hypothetical protein